MVYGGWRCLGAYPTLAALHSVLRSQHRGVWSCRRLLMNARTARVFTSATVVSGTQPSRGSQLIRERCVTHLAALVLPVGAGYL